MQEAEELSGPEGYEYVEVMAAIAQDAEAFALAAGERDNTSCLPARER